MSEEDAKQSRREVCWLIEMTNNDAPTARWWHPKEGWVWDANKALRFARQIDAEDFAKCMYASGGKATEHVFLAAA
ncbi:hypothetical protein MPL3356_60528 [Mesorhizobium plurifarium]|uniref:Uncharacterized protein n=1 Tax=Mesorhizobium plurifarium TaxID=69974 RepID=A0A090E9Y9_MESPL|nr:hypothetical protein MPL3356_60528 [Mesorhizobium plurifarium]